MSFRKFVVFVDIFTALLMAALLLLIYQAIELHQSLENSEKRRFESVNLAHELFQSSEDLTRFARSYVVTGNPVYKENFDQVREIRSGLAPRPSDYGHTYWYTGQQQEARSEPPESLTARMEKTGFTVDELNLLRLAQERSETLIKLEDEAFRAIERAVNSSSEADREYALELVFGDKYIRAKSKIMEPIKNVIDSVEARTENERQNIESALDKKIRQIWFLIVFALASTTATLIFTAKRFVNPLKQLSELDPLTKLCNRRSFYDLVRNEGSRSSPSQTYALMMLDIDHFKRVNDTFDHHAGDQVLKMIADIMKDELRVIDVIARWGGEEFVALIPQTSDETGTKIAERLRQRIEKSQFPIHSGQSIEITASIGIAMHFNDVSRLEDWIDLADKFLYEAKNTGRNKVVSGSGIN